MNFLVKLCIGLLSKGCVLHVSSALPVILSVAADTVSHLTSSQILWPRSRLLSDEGHRECRKCPMAERVPGKDDPTQ